MEKNIILFLEINNQNIEQEKKQECKELQLELVKKKAIKNT